MDEITLLNSPALVSIWLAERPVSWTEIPGDPTRRSGEVSMLVDTGLVKKTLLSTTRCPSDEERLVVVDNGRALVCPKCGHTIELSKGESLVYYSLQIDPLRISDRVRVVFESHGFKVAKTSSFPSVRDVWAIGTILGVDGNEMDLLVSRRQVSTAMLLHVWGHCASTRRCAALVNPGLTDQANAYLRLSFQTSPVLAVPSGGLDQASTFETAARFTSFRRAVESKLAGVERFFVREVGEHSSEQQTPSLDEIDKLSRTGRRAYEPVALGLLSALGPTLAFGRRERVQQVPDGLLVLPDGFWLVDAKSSGKGFAYLQPERDQAWRYIETVEKRSDQFTPTWRFYGEIIVTPTDAISADDIQRARRDLRARGTNSIVTIVSHEGLRRLWDRTRHGNEYWYRRLLSEDPRDLLLLKPRFLRDSLQAEAEILGQDTPLRVVTGAILDHYWEIVNSSPYSLPGGHDPDTVLSQLEAMFIRDYAN